uniref:Uncharacterized protein n=1 Tax=Zooxanthella nutricula TaxID=1333877 RepID=A0A7S2JTX0_9DINO
MAAEGIAWFLIFAAKRQDQRSFLSTTGCKLAAAYMAAFVLRIGQALCMGLPMERRQCVPDAIGAFALGPCMLALAAAGIEGTARLPVLGPRVVTFALTFGRRVIQPQEAAAADAV